MRLVLTVLVSLAAPLGFAQAQKPDATVTLKKLTENRELSLEKDAFSGWNNRIELKLHVDGASVQGARKYGKVEVTKAVDDAGTDLTKTGEGPSRNPKDFREIPKPMAFGRQDTTPKPTGFDFELELPTPSSRAAKSIQEMSGSLQVLVGGEKKIIRVKPIKANVGKTINDPALKSLGVTFELIDPSKRPAGQQAAGSFFSFFGAGDQKKGVSAVISGQVDAITEVSIVDGAGKKLNSSAMWQDAPGKRSITYGVENPLPDDAGLEIEVWPGQKTVTVPIELKDVKLP